MEKEKVIKKLNQLTRERKGLIKKIHETEDMELVSQFIEHDQELKKKIKLCKEILSCF